MTSENAKIFLKWCNAYPWITDHNEKIVLDMDHKICYTNPNTWTYMFKNKQNRDKFRGIISEAS